MSVYPSTHTHVSSHICMQCRRRTREERARAALKGSAEGEEDLDDIITSPVQLEVEVRACMYFVRVRCFF